MELENGCHSLDDQIRAGSIFNAILDAEAELEYSPASSSPEPLSPTRFPKRPRPSSDSDSDSDDEFKDTRWRDDVLRALSRPLKDKRPGRQGRSAESRKRAKLEKEGLKEFLLERERLGLPFGGPEETRCKECSGSSFIEDRSTGDVICAGCGLVESAAGLGFSDQIQLRIKNKSKPYQRVVHFRQRYAQLTGRDPQISEELFEDILFKIDELRIDPKFFGKKDFSLVLKALGRPETKRLSANWIQVRRRMGQDEIPPEIEDEPELFKRLCARYQVNFTLSSPLQKKTNLWSEIDPSVSIECSRTSSGVPKGRRAGRRGATSSTSIM